MSPRKVAEKVRKRWGKALYIAPNRPGGSTSASSGTNTFSERHVAADCGAHPHRVPVAGKGDTGRVFGNLEIERALDPRLLAKPDRRGGVIRGGAR